MATFDLFSADHLGALAAVGLACLGAAKWARPQTFPRCLAWLILAAEAAEPLVRWSQGSLTWSEALPLELCDIAAFATALALLTRSQAVFEHAWFWGLTGTLAALATPTVGAGFPDVDFFRFFIMHGGIVAGVFYLGLNRGMRPRPGAVWRIYAVTGVYAACVGLLDYVLEANYFFLCRPPAALELFGRFHILAGAAIAAGAFWLLDRAARRPAPS